MTAAAEEAIGKMPKVELHLHLEGCVDRDALAATAAGSGLTSAGVLDELYAFNDFPGFLQAFRRINELLTDPGDFRTLGRSVAARLRQQNIVYAELTFTPLIHTRLGLDHYQIIDALLEGLTGSAGEGEQPRLGLIYDTVRQWGPDAALETVELALADRERGIPVAGYGVGGDEHGWPAEGLAEAFELAGSRGLGRFVHAGETGSARSVWEAVEVLGAARIGHGIAAVADRELMRTLAERGICLDVCLTSNVLTGAVPVMAAHPWLELVRAGVPVSLGSDDPAFFGCWLTDELLRARDCWGLDEGFFRSVMETAAAHSFQDYTRREDLIGMVSPPG